MAVPEVWTLTAAATVPPVAEATKEYSPLARQPVEAAAPQSAPPWMPSTLRGSKAHAAFGASGVERVKVTGAALEPPDVVSGRNEMVGVTAVVPMFCTMIVLKRENDPLFLAAYAP